MGLITSTNDYIEITGQDPVLDTPYLIGEALAGSLGAQAAAVTKIWKMRTVASNGNKVYDQRICIDIRAAVNSASGISNVLSPLDLADIRPGIIYVSESAFGEVGPRQNRRGVDQIAQMVTGMSAEMRSIDSPKLFPQDYYFIDYLTGYLGAAGACAALIKRAVEGGSY